jgi:hypothetical protein
MLRYSRDNNHVSVKGDFHGGDDNRCIINIPESTPSSSEEFDEVQLALIVPKLSFQVDYFLLHVKDGSDDWLSGGEIHPINKVYRLLNESNASNKYVCTIKTRQGYGFQFKFFADCDADCRVYLVRELEKHFGYIPNESDESGRFRLVEQGQYDSHIWFIHPDYHRFVTCDKLHPFMNNYYHTISHKHLHS